MRPAGIMNEPFPVKLFYLLQEAPPNVISWTHSGQGFIIEDGTLMCQEVLPRYFRHDRLASFQRQLNLCARAARALSLIHI